MIFKVVINCGGPYSDLIRDLVDDGRTEKQREYIVPAMGAHLTLPRAYSAACVSFYFCFVFVLQNLYCLGRTRGTNLLEG